MKYSSQLLEHAVDEISKLPGIGKRSSMRLALHLLKHPLVYTTQLAQAMVDLRGKINFCEVCHNISDTERCSICIDSRRNHTLVCVVESVNEVIAIENTGQYNGVYHVLGGIISPLNGVGPSSLNIDTLVQRASNGSIEEVVIALSTTMEGDTTAFYIQRKLAEVGVKVSSIARGVSFGDEIEYADEITLGQSIVNRLPMK